MLMGHAIVGSLGPTHLVFIIANLESLLSWLHFLSSSMAFFVKPRWTALEGINATRQVPQAPGIYGLTVLETANSALERKSCMSPIKRLVLVFSDDFMLTFFPGEGPSWKSADHRCGVTE
ncbi:hypothetical protein BKA70DRAFT_532743 [Coprinopsis sp. MPI-PUGE-AT-0042]|nr:hypothetical protein BKA70DRAFT_532743 [Coprinopsis sp. MPI-PUGE-AT-0042]